MRDFVDGLVSIIIPVYNCEQFILQTIESVVSQTYEQIELILVDDCSKDNSAKIIKSYQEKSDKIHYILQAENGGAAVARNTALKFARGRYVAFLDSDDIWLENKLEKQIKLMREKNAAFSFTAIEMIDEEGNLKKKKRKIKEVIDYKFLLKRTIVPTSSVVIDRQQMGDFQMQLRRSGQDYATWLMLLRDGTKAYGINEALVKYRVRSNSLSSNKAKSFKQVYDVQVNQEKIKPFVAFINCCFFAWYAVLKYFL